MLLAPLWTSDIQYENSGATALEGRPATYHAFFPSVGGAHTHAQHAHTRRGGIAGPIDLFNQSVVILNSSHPRFHPLPPSPRAIRLFSVTA